MAADARLMDLSGTRLGVVPLFGRVVQVIASPDGVHDLQVAYLQTLPNNNRSRRVVRLHSAGSLARAVHVGDAVLVKGVVEPGMTGGFRISFRPDGLRVAHTHGNSFDAGLVFRTLSRSDAD